MKGKFRNLIKGERPVLVDFHATWCGPCRQQTPILNSVSSAVGDKAKIIKIDVDKNRSLAQQYQVKGVPTLILFKKGRPVWRQSGVANKQQLVTLINKNA